MTAKLTIHLTVQETQHLLDCLHELREKTLSRLRYEQSTDFIRSIHLFSRIAGIPINGECPDATVLLQPDD